MNPIIKKILNLIFKIIAVLLAIVFFRFLVVYTFDNLYSFTVTKIVVSTDPWNSSIEFLFALLWFLYSMFLLSIVVFPLVFGGLAYLDDGYKKYLFRKLKNVKKYLFNIFQNKSPKPKKEETFRASETRK